tara:strand:- start:1680 stop:1853 length:174 start_codon:yes stop_codon:yes gene_type:complete
MLTGKQLDELLKQVGCSYMEPEKKKKKPTVDQIFEKPKNYKSINSSNGTKKIEKKTK